MKRSGTSDRSSTTASSDSMIVEDDVGQQRSMVELIGDDDIEIVTVASGEEALDELHRGHFDCMVLDLGLGGGMSGFDLLERVKSDQRQTVREIPIIIYTGRELSQPEETRLRKYAETIIVKDVKSPERLLDETALFLHRVEAKLPETKRRMLEQLHNTDAVFAGKHVLIVDDDVRNIFSLTSVLESHGMNVAFAENGRDALAPAGERSRHGSRADGRDDAGDGWVRDDTGDPAESAFPIAADHRADGEGDEG